MNELDDFPYLQALGQQFDALAERDARRPAGRDRLAARYGVPRISAVGRLAPAMRLAVIVGLAVVFAGGVYAVPATRAAISDAYSTLSDWVSGNDSAAPGRAVVPGEAVPSWVSAEDGQKRVLAEADGQKLFAIRQGNKLTLALDDFGMTATIDEEGRSVSGQQIMVVGPGQFVPNGRHELRPLFGLATATIARITLRYADGGPSVSQSGLTGAFAMTIEANRRPATLTGYDRENNVVARLEFVTNPQELRPGKTLGDFRYCPNAATGCPPWTD